MINNRIEGDNNQIYDAIILGSGPAGLTAAIYARRAGLKTLVVTGNIWGGQLMLATTVENYPGFENGIQGPNLMENMKKQAERFGAEFIYGEVIEIDFSRRPFKIKLRNKECTGKTVIIATGASAKWLNIKGEKKFRGKGVSVCAVCDGAFFKNKKLIVVGGGDTAMEEAIFLTKIASEVIIVHRRDRLRASKILQQQAFKNSKIRFIWNCTVQEIIGKDYVEAVKLISNDSSEQIIKCDGVFIAIGHLPNTQVFRNQINLDKEGYVIATDTSKTNIEGVFVAGDVKDRIYRQVITAAASGCKAAIDAEKDLRRNAAN